MPRLVRWAAYDGTDASAERREGNVDAMAHAVTGSRRVVRAVRVFTAHGPAPASAPASAAEHAHVL